MLLKATPDLTFLLRGDYTHDHTADFHKLLPATSAYYTGASQWFTPDPRAAYNDIQNDEPGHDAGVSLTIENTNPLGKLTSVTSYRKFKADPIFNDSDQVATPGTFFPACIGRLGDVVGSKSFYHETYIATDPKKPLSVIVGGTFFNEHAYEYKHQLTDRRRRRARRGGGAPRDARVRSAKSGSWTRPIGKCSVARSAKSSCAG